MPHNTQNLALMMLMPVEQKSNAPAFSRIMQRFRMQQPLMYSVYKILDALVSWKQPKCNFIHPKFLSVVKEFLKWNGATNPGRSSRMPPQQLSSSGVLLEQAGAGFP